MLSGSPGPGEEPAAEGAGLLFRVVRRLVLIVAGAVIVIWLAALVVWCLFRLIGN
jgi:hypothetical protein